MSNHSYQAINENGTTVSGVIEADSADTAKNILLTMGYIPLNVRAAGRSPGSFSLSKMLVRLNTVKASDVILFTKQMRSMFSAGVPIIRLLEVLEAQTQNLALKKVIQEMVDDIKKGSTLSDAIEKHPSVFSRLYCSMIRAGEASGAMVEVLNRLIYINEHEAAVKADIKAALQYPKVVLVALAVAFFVLLTVVIPKFVIIFSKAGLKLPIPTQIAMLLYYIISSYWYVMIGVVLMMVFGYKFYMKTWQGRYARDVFFLKIPIVGPLFIKTAMSRFASIFVILLSSGVPILNAISILSKTIGNEAISKSFDKIKEQLAEGQGIAKPLKSAKYFTPMVVDMVAIGEESGKMEDMLREVTKHYDDEVAYAVKGLSTVIGPVLIVGLAAVVGFFALAIFLPMWDLTKLAH